MVLFNFKKKRNSLKSAAVERFSIFPRKKTPTPLWQKQPFRISKTKPLLQSVRILLYSKLPREAEFFMRFFLLSWISSFDVYNDYCAFLLSFQSKPKRGKWNNSIWYLFCITCGNTLTYWLARYIEYPNNEWLSYILSPDLWLSHFKYFLSQLNYNL